MALVNSIRDTGLLIGGKTHAQSDTGYEKSRNRFPERQPAHKENIKSGIARGGDILRPSENQGESRIIC
jgi:hypothetical protein